MKPIPAYRRFGIAIAALSIGALLLRPQIGLALVVRGDDFLYRGNVARAQMYYARALRVDPSSSVAADRFVFYGMEQHTPHALSTAIEVATSFLQAHPDDASLLADRALCYAFERRYHDAEPDFEHAAQLTHDPRYFTFAGWAAERTGLHARARLLWRLALQADPQFMPARSALLRSRP